MAVLKKPVTTAWSFFDNGEVVPPKGTFRATCIQIEDRFDQERKKFQSEEVERCDLTQFNFGFTAKDGTKHRIASKVMKISMDDRATLYGFLRSWLGEAPKEGWDYAQPAPTGMKGAKAQITIDHELRKSGDSTYATIVAIAPILEDSAETTPESAPAAKAKKASKPAPVETTADEIPF